MSRPAIATAPSVGESSAPIMFRSVVLPLPEGPSTTMNSLLRDIERAPSSAVTVTSPSSYPGVGAINRRMAARSPACRRSAGKSVRQGTRGPRAGSCPGPGREAGRDPDQVAGACEAELAGRSALDASSSSRFGGSSCWADLTPNSRFTRRTVSRRSDSASTGIRGRWADTSRGVRPLRVGTTSAARSSW